jgi:hypothetical protein
MILETETNNSFGFLIKGLNVIIFSRPSSFNSIDVIIEESNFGVCPA